MMKTAAVLFAAALLLAGCGGDNVSWCYASDSGNVSAGYNSSCPDGQAQRPPAATKGEAAPDD